MHALVSWACVSILELSQELVFQSKSWWRHLVSPPINFNRLSNLYGIEELGDSLYPKTPAVFGIKDTRWFHSATAQESGSKGRIFNVFIKASNYPTVALWPMQDSSYRQERALRRATTPL